MLVDSRGLPHICLQEGWVDVAPANPVRSERKQPQWDAYGSSSLPLFQIFIPRYICFVKNDRVIPLGIRILRGNMYFRKRNFGTGQGVISAT